jgi:hypothetical protein
MGSDMLGAILSSVSVFIAAGLSIYFVVSYMNFEEEFSKRAACLAITFSTFGLLLVLMLPVDIRVASVDEVEDISVANDIRNTYYGFLLVLIFIGSVPVAFLADFCHNLLGTSDERRRRRNGAICRTFCMFIFLVSTGVAGYIIKDKEVLEISPQSWVNTILSEQTNAQAGLQLTVSFVVTIGITLACIYVCSGMALWAVSEVLKLNSHEEAVGFTTVFSLLNHPPCNDPTLLSHTFMSHFCVVRRRHSSTSPAWSMT